MKTTNGGELFNAAHLCLCAFDQETEAAPSPARRTDDNHHSQQEELASLQQQFQQLCSDVDQLTTELKHLSVTNAQVAATPSLPALKRISIHWFIM